MRISEVILKPVLTEKASGLTNSKVYTFEVSEEANKHTVKEVLEKLYNIKVGSIRAMVRKGKIRRVGKKMQTKQLKDRKIMLVSLKEGKIDLFPQA